MSKPKSVKELSQLSEFVRFKSIREQLLWIALSRLFFHLRFSAYDSEKAADWGIVIWRIFWWGGAVPNEDYIPDSDEQLSKIADTLGSLT